MWRGLAQGNTTSSVSWIPMISQRAVSCPVVELPNILFITELLCGGLLKERLWVFLCQALILGERLWYFFTKIHLSLSSITGRCHRYFCQCSWCIRGSRSAVSLRLESCMSLRCPLFHSTFGTHSHYQRTRILTLSLCSSYRQILNGIPTLLLPNTPIIRIRLSKKVPIYA